MKTLHLLRHAKSSWDDPSLSDEERPLSPRGRRAATAMAHHFQEKRMAPDRVLCSPSLRTRQTLDYLIPVLGSPENGGDVVFEPVIYEASPHELLELIRSTPPETSSLLLIGHNPGLASLAASLLAPNGHDASLSQLRRKYPTGALATFHLPGGEWKSVRPGSGRLLSFVRPRDLPSA
jgi:phosphohistidine phosphatase